MYKVVPLFMLVTMVTAAVYRGKLPEIPRELAHKQGCFIAELNDVIPFGEEVTPVGQCVSIDCGRHGISYATCGVASAEPPCYVTKGNPSAVYPDCCPTMKCEQDNLIHNSIVPISRLNYFIQ